MQVRLCCAPILAMIAVTWGCSVAEAPAYPPGSPPPPPAAVVSEQYADADPTDFQDLFTSTS